MTLAEAGYAVELAAHPLAGEGLDPRIRLHSLGEYGVPMLAWRLSQRFRRSQRAYELACSSDAALFQYYSLEFIPWGTWLRRVTRRSVVFDCMEDFEGYVRQRRGIPDVLRRPLALLVKSQLRLAARSCDAIIVADEGTANLLGPYARRLVTLYNFPRLDLFPDMPGGTVDRQYDIVYHGSIPKYHLEVCLAVDALLVQRGYYVRWRFIGRLPEMEWLMGRLTRLGIRDRFCISGMVPHDQVAQEICKARIGIIPLPDLPKFQNNIPQKLFEYMALRMPVVMTDLPPSRQFVGDGQCAIMVKPGDYNAYADAIIQLLDNPSLCAQMGAEGRRRVEQEYNWEKESRKLLALYEELLS